MYILGAFHSRWVTIAAKLHLTGVIPHRVSLLAAEPLQGRGMWRSSWDLLARTLFFLSALQSQPREQVLAQCRRSCSWTSHLVSWSKLTSWESYEIEPIWTNPQKIKGTKVHQDAPSILLLTRWFLSLSLNDVFLSVVTGVFTCVHRFLAMAAAVMFLAGTMQVADALWEPVRNKHNARSLL